MLCGDKYTCTLERGACAYYSWCWSFCAAAQIKPVTHTRSSKRWSYSHRKENYPNIGI